MLIILDTAFQIVLFCRYFTSDCVSIFITDLFSVIDWLRAGRSGDRIPVGARFSAIIQTGPGAHPASYTMGTGVFPRGKEQPRDADPSPPSSAVVMKGVELYLYSPYGPYGLYRASVPVQGCTLPSYCNCAFAVT